MILKSAFWTDASLEDFHEATVYGNRSYRERAKAKRPSLAIDDDADAAVGFLN